MKEPQPDRSPIPDMEEADQANGERAEPAERIGTSWKDCSNEGRALGC